MPILPPELWAMIAEEVHSSWTDPNRLYLSNLTVVREPYRPSKSAVRCLAALSATCKSLNQITVPLLYSSIGPLDLEVQSHLLQYAPLASRQLTKSLVWHRSYHNSWSETHHLSYYFPNLINLIYVHTETGEFKFTLPQPPYEARDQEKARHWKRNTLLMALGGKGLLNSNWFHTLQTFELHGPRVLQFGWDPSVLQDLAEDNQVAWIQTAFNELGDIMYAPPLKVKDFPPDAPARALRGISFRGQSVSDVMLWMILTNSTMLNLEELDIQDCDRLSDNLSPFLRSAWQHGRDETSNPRANDERRLCYPRLKHLNLTGTYFVGVDGIGDVWLDDESAGSVQSD